MNPSILLALPLMLITWRISGFNMMLSIKLLDPSHLTLGLEFGLAHYCIVERYRREIEMKLYCLTLSFINFHPVS